MVNEAISASELMLIDQDGQNLGVVSREQAFFIAQEFGLDIVVVSSSANPPVARLLDLGKERYEQEKKARKHRAAQRSGEVKEIKLSFRIEEHDWETKKRRAERFLSKGDRLKLFMRLVGRENDFATEAKAKIEKFAAELGTSLESFSRQGSRLTAILTKQNAKTKNS